MNGLSEEDREAIANSILKRLHELGIAKSGVTKVIESPNFFNL